jgi:hypothetical protein
MTSFTIIKDEHDVDAVEYKNKLIAWLTERLGKVTAHTNFSIFNDNYIADDWDLEVSSLFGKFHNWCMSYTVDIRNDLVAVEFALVKDSL